MFMGKTKRILILLIFIFFANLITKSQTTSINQGSISDRFDYVIKNSEVINDTRIIKNWWIFALKNSVNDTIKELKEEIINIKKNSTKYQTKIDSLTNLLSHLNSYINELENNKNKISLLGIPINKKNYNKIMFNIIALLIFISLILFVIYKRNNKLTKRYINDLNELREEFENYRKRTLEREQKIVREMYDEILKYKNKLNELTNK